MQLTSPCLHTTQAGGGVVLATMKDTSEENVNVVSQNAYLLVLAMDFAIGIIAYVTFTDETQGNVLLNFVSDSPIAIVARLALLDLVVLSYMIMVMLTSPARGCSPAAVFLYPVLPIPLRVLTTAHFLEGAAPHRADDPVQVISYRPLLRQERGQARGD